MEHGIKPCRSSAVVGGEEGAGTLIIDFRACLLPVNGDCRFPRGYGGIQAAPGIYLERSA